MNKEKTNNRQPYTSPAWWGFGLGMLVGVGFLLSQAVFAQGTNLGLDEFANNTNLGTNIELIGLISRIINIILGFLGVIAIGLIIYAGWLWLTSAGDAQKIAKAKKIMIGAVIGLAIILSAFAIASFIIRQIINSTTGGGGGYLCSDGNPPPCPPPILPGSYLSVRSQAPQGNGIKLCTAVQATFSEAVQWSTVNSTNFAIQEASTGTLFTSGTYQPGVDASNISFTHVGNEFAPNTTYRVTLRSGLSGLQGVSNIGLRTDKVWTFTTGTESDDTAPEVLAHQPPDGSVEVCRNTPIQVVFSEPMLATSFTDNVHLRIQGGSSDIPLSEPYFGDGYRIANFDIAQTLLANTTYEITLDGGPGGITDMCSIPLEQDFTWTFATGETVDCSPSIDTVVPDARDYGQLTTITGSNLFLDGEVYINNYPADSNSFPGVVPPENILCYAGVSRDGGTTTCTASQVRVRAPVGASTGPYYDQNGFTATTGEVRMNVAGQNSNELPFTITSPYIDWLSPGSGGVGQFVTISGWNFGDIAGQVRFVRPDGTWVAGTPPDACDDWWTETEIVIKVPTGLVAGVSYQMEVWTADRGTNGGNKRSNSESFLVTSQPPGPGICTLVPNNAPLLSLPLAVTVTGERFGNTRGASVLTFDNSNNINSTNYTSWGENEIIAETPTSGGVNLLGSGNWRAQVKVGGVLSNWKTFTVGQDTTVYPQVVDYAGCSLNTQSPSPYRDTTEACGNSLISARFTTAMNQNTLTVGSSSNIRVQECGNGVTIGPCNISLSFNRPNFIYDAQNNVIGFSALPNTNMRQGYWYQGVITTGVTSAAGVPLQNPYVWQFKVSSSFCPIANVLLSPSYATIREVVPDPGSEQDFTASATAANCNIIDPSDYSWRWTAANNPADPAPPQRLQLATGGNTYQNGLTQMTVEALDWTPAGEPARVTVEAVGENKSDTSDVYVSGTFCTEFEDCNACGTGISRCVAGVCEPVITNISPTDGAPGTWVTINGCYFGNARGRILYTGGDIGLWPDPAICGPNTWSNTQVISEVPARANSGPLTLERANPPGGSDVSAQSFNVNTVSRPGLCRLTPSYHYEDDLGTPAATVTMVGRGFGSLRTPQDNVNYYFANVYTGSPTNYPAWSDKQTQAISPQVPAVTVGQNQLSVNKALIESNRLNYTIRPGGGSGVGESCDRDPNTPMCEDNGSCDSGLFCDASSRCTCQLIGGTGQLPRITSVQPSPGSQNICRNTVITLTFDQNVTNNTIRNGELLVTYDGTCTPPAITFNWWQRLVRLFKVFLPSQAQGIATVSGSLSSNGNTITFTPNEPLCADEPYTVRINSPRVDCANSGGLCQFNFRTSNNICEVDSVDIDPPNHNYTSAGQVRGFIAQAKAIDGQPLAASYSWELIDPDDVVDPFVPFQDVSTVDVESNNKNGEAELRVTAEAYSSSATTSAALNVFLCEVPWILNSPDYDFDLMYCRGQTGDSDLLPQLSVASQPGGGELLRSYFFKHPDIDEVIGLRIYGNPQHLSPKQWYESRPDIIKGNPSSVKVDGYEALKDIQAAYVGAVNQQGTNLYTNIYVLSYSSGAGQEMLNIYNQMLQYWIFNPALAANSQVQLQRDLLRLQDIAGIGSKLGTYASSHAGRYPRLTAGTFQVGRSTSVWSSWQAELGNDLSSALPLDPINKFVNCPAGYDPVTCWRASDKSFVCPAGSHAYQYLVGTAGLSYTLMANLEFKNVTWVGDPDVTITGDACDSYSVNGGTGLPPINEEEQLEVDGMTIQLFNSPTNNQLTISWTPSTLESQYYEVWRAPDIPGNSPGTWSKIAGPVLNRTLNDIPPSDGGWWYNVRSISVNDTVTIADQPVLAVKDSSPPSDPVCNPPGGTYTTTQQVSCTGGDQGDFPTSVNVHFTSGSITPSCGSPIFNNPTSIKSSATLNFISCDIAKNASSVVTHDYIINSVVPTATLNLQAQDNLGNSLAGINVSIDGQSVGVTPTSSTVSYGSRTVNFSNSLACYVLAQINPAQPIDVTGDATVVGVFNVVSPGTINSPSPANGANAVSSSVKLSWSAVACSTSYDIYFGTSQTAVQNATTSSPEYRANSESSTYDPGTLNYSTTYYWRIDARNSAGTSKGTVWSFTTEAIPTATITFNTQDSGGANLPGAFARLDGSLVGVTPTSTTVPYGSHTASFDDTVACYSFNSLTPAQPMNVTGNITVRGTFSLNSPAPANTPTPVNGATGVLLTTNDLTWSSGNCTSSYDIYFGTSQTAVQNATTSSPEFKLNDTKPAYSINQPLNYATTYYWRIDARNSAGTSQGTVWSFTTEATPTTSLTLNTLDDAGSALVGAAVRLDGAIIGTTPTSTSTTIGTHTISFDNTVTCYTYASVSPPQPMNVTGNTTITGTYNRNAPGQVAAAGSNPANGATNTPLNAALSWSAVTCGTGYNIYFGTNSTSLSQVGSTTTTTFNPGALNYSTTYYWRVDSVNNGRVTIGQVLSFTTQATPAYTVTFQTRDNVGNNLTGATARLDGTFIGTTPTSSSALMGTHTASFDNTVACYTYASVSPAQPMNITGNVIVTGTFNANLPGNTLNPNPTNGSTGISTNVSLSWSGTSCTSSYDVYFGTSQTAVQNATTSSPEFKLNTASINYGLSGLNYSTSYYWRIDARNSAGTSKGTVWSFTTMSQPSATVTFQTRDNTGNNLTGATARLDGTFVGTTPTSTTTLLGTHTASFDNTLSCYSFASVSPAQPMNVTGNVTVIGTFNLSSPGQAFNPIPGDKANSSTNPTLSWSAGSCTSSYDVYFGNNETAVQNATTSSPEFRLNTTNNSYNPGTLLNGQTYYWRIDARNGASVTKGTVWSFYPVMPTISVEARDDQNNRIHGVPVYFDGVWVGITYGYQPLYLTVPMGWHTVSFNSTYDCYNFSNITPTQPMNVTGDNTVTATFLPLSVPPAASAYSPLNGATGIRPVDIVTDGISFSIYCGTSYFDIYYGTSQLAVNNATTTSPEHVGTYTVTQLPGPTFYVGTPANDTVYYWRVDTRNIRGVTKGAVWSFKTAP